MWVCKWLYVPGYVPSGVCPGVVSLDRMEGLLIVFWGAFILLSIVVTLIYVPINSIEVFLFLHSLHLLLFSLLVIAILPEERWNLNVVLIWIFFISKDVKHFFMYLLTVSTSLENCLCSSFAYLFSGLFILCRVRILSSLYILVIKPFSDVYLAEIFSHSAG
jgi:hypothetical protein